MKNEIITLSPVTIDSREFKDPRLQKATAKIAAIYQNAAKYADTKNREIASILASVADDKAYEADGFKSVADYANQTFGIARQNAYALAKAGKVYNDDNTPESLKSFSPSKLAEIASLPMDAISKDIEAGNISAATTQKDLREYAKKVKDETSALKSPDDIKPEVLDRYTARPCLVSIPESIAAEIDKPRIVDEWDKFFIDQIAGLTSSDTETVEVVKLTKCYAAPWSKKATVPRKLYFNSSFSIVVEFWTYVQKAEKLHEELPKYTIEELKAMLKEAEENLA